MSQKAPGRQRGRGLHYLFLSYKGHSVANLQPAMSLALQGHNIEDQPGMERDSQPHSASAHLLPACTGIKGSPFGPVLPSVETMKLTNTGSFLATEDRCVSIVTIVFMVTNNLREDKTKASATEFDHDDNATAVCNQIRNKAVCGGSH